MAYDALASSLTLTGSTCSCVGSACIIACFIVYHRTQRSFRHVLVFSLAVSDFINSLNNTISGSIYVATHNLSAGAACTFNGWVGQLSVQATDFSILAIGISTLLVVTKQTRLDSISPIKKALLCLAIWTMPLISSTTVTALGEMQPVSGNWCWIARDRPDLRYGLAHGWRFAIIFATICIYVYIYQYLTRHFRSLVMPSALTEPPQPQPHRRGPRSVSETNLTDGVHEYGIPLGTRRSTTIVQTFEDRKPHTGSFTPGVVSEISSSTYHLTTPGSEMNLTKHHVGVAVTPETSSSSYFHKASKDLSNPGTRHLGLPGGSSASTTKYSSGRRRTRDTVETEIKRMLLLNGYPIMYIILWIPGMTNRIMEASGQPSSSKVLAALQCSTQFVGFANALTYGLNREMRQILARDLRRLFFRGKSTKGLALGD